MGEPTDNLITVYALEDLEIQGLAEEQVSFFCTTRDRPVR
ncbi:MAG: hypothetical protein QOF89_3036 [Acidobacteriota bacterium]|nr:hypothetical protein [Acidobacteriota bacterium]